jgi:hypothetical protein
MVLVADASQDVYETARRWTDEAMNGAGFSGRWSELLTSYRLPGPLLDIVGSFAERYLPADLRQKPQRPPAQGVLALESTELKWVQVHRNHAVTVCIDETMAFITTQDSPTRAMTDLTVLTDNRAIGVEIVRRLNTLGIKTTETFSLCDGQEGHQDRRKKLAFWKGRERIKVATIHSFKGWEARLLVVLITKAKSQKDHALIYTGMTRLKKHQDGSNLWARQGLNL